MPKLVGDDSGNGARAELRREIWQQLVIVPSNEVATTEVASVVRDVVEGELLVARFDII